MNKTKKHDAQVTEQGTAEQKVQQMDADAGGQSAALNGAQESAGLTPAEENKAELVEGVLQPYAVAFKGMLRLRQEPSPDAPIITELPCGAGVFADGTPGPDGWLHVLTGRLSGWMMEEYLEALPLPELDNVAG